MPELPEVEFTRRGFAERIAGARVLGVRLGKPLRWPLGVDPDMLVGRVVQRVERRGKYLWMAFAEGGGLLLHLGMSGSLSFGEPAAGPGPYDHFDLVTTGGTLRLTDPRRFGAVVWADAPEAGMAGKLLASLGIEPFDDAFDGPYLHRALQRRSVAVKQALLAGDIVTGAGNIYACEALFDAGLDPRLPSNKVSRPRAAKLAAAVRAVLERALGAGGSTLRNYRSASGEPGAFQRIARVYGRAGQPCVRCGTAIRRIVQGGRSTFFCPVCQRR